MQGAHLIIRSCHEARHRARQRAAGRAAPGWNFIAPPALQPPEHLEAFARAEFVLRGGEVHGGGGSWVAAVAAGGGAAGGSGGGAHTSGAEPGGCAARGAGLGEAGGEGGGHSRVDGRSRVEPSAGRCCR